MSVTAVVAAPLVPITQQPPAPQIRLAATPVPPGGLITSIVRNQGIYCSIICPLLVDTAATALSTTLGAPGTFVAALPADGLLKAIGAAAASITGPTDAAMERAIAADAAIPAQRALNAFEVGVVGVLDVVSAFGAGPAAVLTAIGQARQQTFDALNAPVQPDPAPTVMPHGVFQVAVVEAINVVGAVIFPAFNDVLAGAFAVPDAVARTLAATGNPAAAVAAGLNATVRVLTAAGTVVAKAVGTAVERVRAAASVSAASARDRTASPSAAQSPVAATHLSQRRGQLQQGTGIGPPTTKTKPGTRAKPTAKTEPRVQTKSAADPGTHRKVRGSHTGRPSRPALRARR